MGHPQGIHWVTPKVGQMKKVTNKSCQVCFSDEKNHQLFESKHPFRDLFLWFIQELEGFKNHSNCWIEQLFYGLDHCAAAMAATGGAPATFSASSRMATSSSTAWLTTIYGFAPQTTAFSHEKTVRRGAALAARRVAAVRQHNRHPCCCRHTQYIWRYQNWSWKYALVGNLWLQR